MHSAFSQTDHRPWPVPTTRWTWRQSWHDLLFIHWPVPLEVLRPLVPSSLTIQTFEGRAWVGVVPFRMTGVMRRPFPDMPWISAFPELNVRLYVEAEGKPGVWFLSLDASNPLAVWAARRFFHLPYFHAQIALTHEGDTISFDATHRDSVFRCRYRPTGNVEVAAPGTLVHWLTERYCLYTTTPTGELVRNEVHHVPWPLQEAEATILENTLLERHGLRAAEGPISFHFAHRLDVVVWPAAYATSRHFSR